MILDIFSLFMFFNPAMKYEIPYFIYTQHPGHIELTSRSLKPGTNAKCLDRICFNTHGNLKTRLIKISKTFQALLTTYIIYAWGHNRQI